MESLGGCQTQANMINESRDDLTVEVVFFGNGERAPNQSQEVVINEDATAAPRAKL